MKKMLLVHWSTSTGPEPIIQYPPETFPPKDLLLKIWTQHELDKESPIIEYIPELDTEGKNLHHVSIIHNFEGEVYFLIISHEQFSKSGKIDKIINEYPEILVMISKNLIKLINTNKITRAISEAYNTIRNFTVLNQEEILLSFFQDKIRNTILKILREGVISKKDLTRTLREEHGFSTDNIDFPLILFIRENLALKLNVPGIKECYFLIQDIILIRIPPELKPEFKFQEDKEIFEQYQQNIIDFFLNYDCISEIESKSILSFLINKDVIKLIQRLREKRLTINECEAILNNDELLVELLENKIIFESKGFVYLFSDLRFIKFKPYYILKRLTTRFQNQEISFDQYISHVNLLTKGLEKQNSYISYEIF